MISEDIKINILIDHYNRQTEINRNERLLRDKLYYAVIFIIAIMFLLISNPSQTQGDIIGFINKISDFNFSVSFNVLNSLLWVMLLFFLLQLYRLNISIEKNYEYIHLMEQKIASLVGDNEAFSKEGKFYLTNYPKLLNFSHNFYSYITPLLIFLVSFLKISIEIKTSFSWFLLFDIAVFGLVFTVIWLYFRYMILNKKT
ncbi:MAG: hypothetical protein BWK80_29575 [Desulfobacteraceae bacterium IS3]|nr:MAG: hypothetical protein BWK80_29575 [Desulfobacteraceae bacterium IS3]